jgi:hypothetical protein
MTYTFKLARRLAASRKFFMLPVLLVFAACNGGDATAPEGSPAESSTAGTEWRPRDIIPVAVRVDPSSVTLETNQLILFRAHARTSAGDSVGAAVTWSATGGTILPDGRFSAAAIGTYAVIGRNRVRGEVQVDTSVVVVVRRQPKLASVQVTPESASLTPGVSQTFTAVGQLLSGRSVPIGVNWSATGGTIDAGGTYVAGDTAGTYQVIGSNTAGTYADTATVSISAPPSPPPPPPGPTPPPTPVLQKITLLPISVTLAPSATKQFVAYGQTTAGDSVAVSVVFKAGGGTISPTGLYTAGSVDGSYKVIATSGGLADTSTVTVSVPLGGGSGLGIPFGSYNMFSGTNLSYGTAPFNYTVQAVVTPSILLSQLQLARSRNMKIVIGMTGGSHDRYLTGGIFDMAKWRAQQALFNTAEMKQAVADAVTDGTIVVAEIIDEPNHRSWGGYFAGNAGVALLDSMAAYTKSIFPTLKTSIVVRYDWIKGKPGFRAVDVIASQYNWRDGDVRAYRDSAVAVSRRSGLGLIFQMNVLDGGTAISGCPVPETGGPGTASTTCRMTAAQVANYGTLLAGTVQACAFGLWRFDPEFVSNPENVSALNSVASVASRRQATRCQRPL